MGAVKLGNENIMGSKKLKTIFLYWQCIIEVTYGQKSAAREKRTSSKHIFD